MDKTSNFNAGGIVEELVIINKYVWQNLPISIY